MPALGTILVIEDDAAIRDLIADFLSDEGYSVRGAADALGGIVALVDGQPDLILLDYDLPRTNPLAFARSIHSTGITTPIVLMIMDKQPPEHPDMVNIALCLPKPFELDELLDCVARYVR